MLTNKTTFKIDESAHAQVAEKMFLLQRSELFSSLPAEDLRLIALRLRTEMLSAGEVIIRQGDLSSDLFVLKSGSVRVSVLDRTLCHLGVGAVVGEMAGIDPAPRSADVTAMEPCCAYRMDGDVFIALLEERPALSEALISLLGRRLRRQLEAGGAPPAGSARAVLEKNLRR